MINGPSFGYSNDGKCNYIAETYSNDKLNGKATQYFDNGKVYWEVEYKDNEYNGKLVEYYKDGKVKKTETYEKGVMLNCEGDCEEEIGD